MHAAAQERQHLLDLIHGSWITQAICTAASLGVADALAHGPKAATEVADACGAHAGSVERLLRALTALQLCVEREPGRFALTPVGDLLRTEAPRSLRQWAIHCGTRLWRTWADLPQAVRAGNRIADLAGARPVFGALEADAQAAAAFNAAMVDLTRPIAASAAERLRWSDTRLVVDVGGGSGELAAAIASRHPGIEAIVFDLSHAAQAAERHLEAHGLLGRCRFMAGDFFDTIPRGGDAYLLKSVLHNWDDARAAVILAACRRAMKPGARLLVLERIVPRGAAATPEQREIARSDLNMLVSCGGRERTLEEFTALFAGAGLALEAVTGLASGFSALAAR
jgi:SAM-dependent methyltransferase